MNLLNSLTPLPMWKWKEKFANSIKQIICLLEFEGVLEYSSYFDIYHEKFLMS